jgi:tRNA A37 threonylcarbamoyladenosine dehydratase
MIRSPELQAVHDMDAIVVHEQVQQIVAELRAIGEAKNAAASRSYHQPLRDVSMSREQLSRAYAQASRKPPQATP